MIYQAEIETPANTAEASPYITRLGITKGLIYKLFVYAPYGAMGLHYAQVFDGAYQVWPSTTGRAFRGDGYMLDFDDLYIKENPPFELIIKTWNLDTAFDHLIWIYVGLVSKEEFMLRFLPGLTYKQMQVSIAELAKQQEAQRQAIIEQGLKGTL